MSMRSSPRASEFASLEEALVFSPSCSPSRRSDCRPDPLHARRQCRSAAAAIAIGSTYDPVVPADRGVRGLASDLDKARSWYERAKEMGSPEGPRRLEMLANR
jgi:hypothetical protein